MNEEELEDENVLGDTESETESTIDESVDQAPKEDENVTSDEDTKAEKVDFHEFDDVEKTNIDSSNNLDSSWSRTNLYLRAERSRNNPHGSPTQYRAKAIIRKYRRHVRQVEFKRLRSIVPAVAGNEKASQVSRTS